MVVGGSASNSSMPPKAKGRGKGRAKPKPKPKPKAKSKPKEQQITLLPDPARDPEAIKLGTLTYSVKVGTCSCPNLLEPGPALKLAMVLS